MQFVSHSVIGMLTTERHWSLSMRLKVLEVYARYIKEASHLFAFHPSVTAVTMKFRSFIIWHKLRDCFPSTWPGSL